MDPNDLVIIDYPPLFEPSSSPSTSNQSIDSGTNDYFIKLNQAWEMEVKNRNDVIDWLMEMERKYQKILRNKANVGFGSNKSFVMEPDIQPIQKTSHKD